MLERPPVRVRQAASGRMQQSPNERAKFRGQLKQRRTLKAASGPTKSLMMRHGSNSKSRVREAPGEWETTQTTSHGRCFARPMRAGLSTKERISATRIGIEIFRSLATTPAQSTVQGITPTGSSSGRTSDPVSSRVHSPGQSGLAPCPKMDFEWRTYIEESFGAWRPAWPSTTALSARYPRKSGIGTSIILTIRGWSS